MIIESAIVICVYTKIKKERIIMKFYHLSDLHYQSKSVWKGTSWEIEKEEGSTLSRFSEEITKKVIDDIKKDHEIDTIIITGDITNQGDRESHMEMVDILRDLVNSGKKVYTMIASHDFSCHPFIIQDGWAKTAIDEFRSEKDACAFYKEFGPNQAISVDDETLSYVVQLNDKIRYISINPSYGDKERNSEMYFSDAFMLWVKEQADKARNDGCIIIAGVHYPILTPSPMYKLVGGISCFIKDPIERARQFADMGINLLLTGHTHIFSMNNMVFENSNNFYQVTTSALTAYPPLYRKIEIDENTSDVKISTIDVGDITYNGKTINVNEATRKNFIGLIEPTVEKMQYDAKVLMLIGGGMETKEAMLEKHNFLITRIARFLNKLTFGKIAKYIKKESGLKKVDYASIKDKKVLPFLVQLVATLYDGKQQYSPDSKEYKVFMSLIAVFDSIIKCLRINIEKITHTKNLYDLIEPMLYNDGIDNYTCEFNLKKPYVSDKSNKKIISKKGWKIVTGVAVLTVLLLPVILPVALIALIVSNIKK